MLFRSILVALCAAALTSASELRGSDPDRELDDPCYDCQCTSATGGCWSGSPCPTGTYECGVTPACTNSIDNGNPDSPDAGCNHYSPVCVGDNDAAGGGQLAADTTGIACAVCFNSLEDDGACDPDDGCPLDKRICKDYGSTPKIWHSGDECVAECRNSDLGDGNDSGCYGHVDAYKLCVNADYSEPGDNAYGACCVPCVNDLPDFGKDRGCPSGSACFNNDGSEPPLGEAGEICVSPFCINTAVYPDSDFGCDQPGYEICVDVDGESPAENEAGVACVPCTDVSKEVSVCFAVDTSGSIGVTAFNNDIIPYVHWSVPTTTRKGPKVKATCRLNS
jgi:hypothetical protein